MDPLTPLTLIYGSVTLPIMCKCMYRKSSRNTAMEHGFKGLAAGKTDKVISYSKQIIVKKYLASVTRL